MKKKLAILICFALVFALAACSSQTASSAPALSEPAAASSVGSTTTNTSVNSDSTLGNTSANSATMTDWLDYTVEVTGITDQPENAPVDTTAEGQWVAVSFDYVSDTLGSDSQGGIIMEDVASPDDFKTFMLVEPDGTAHILSVVMYPGVEFDPESGFSTDPVQKSFEILYDMPAGVDLSSLIILNQSDTIPMAEVL